MTINITAPPMTKVYGCKLQNAILWNPQEDIVSGGNMSFSSKTFSTIGSSGTPGVKCLISYQLRADGGWNYTFKITNTSKYRLDRVDIKLPEVSTDDSDNWINYSPYQGGIRAGLTTSNSSVWPGTAYSPIAALYNTGTGETLGICFFNDQFVPCQLYWFAGDYGAGKYFNCFVRYFLSLMPGQSQTFTVEYIRMTGGLPTLFSYYRTNKLIPAMTALGITEATHNIGAGIGLSDFVADNGLAAKVQQFVDIDIHDYIQWSPTSSNNYFTVPYPGQTTWYDEGTAARAISGVHNVGIFVNFKQSPFISTDARALIDGAYSLTNLDLDLSSPRNREYYCRMRDQLFANGFNLGFWDSWAQVAENSRQPAWYWISLLKNWKAKGIALACESSCDVAAYITGTWIQFPYPWNDYTLNAYDLAKAVTPSAALMVTHYTTGDQSRSGVFWYDAATLAGLKPVMDLTQATAWAT